MRIIAISHCADIDGVGAVGMLLTKYQIRPADIFFIDYSEGDIKRVEREINRQKPKETNLFITDLNADAKTVAVYLSIIRTIKKGGGKVFWLDHHPWGKEAIARLPGECDIAIHSQKRECATDITIRQLKLNSKFVKEFKRVCHISDLALPIRDSRSKYLIKTYALGISSYNTKPYREGQKGLLTLAKTLASGKLLNKGIIAESRKFDAISKKRIREMVKDLSLIGDKIAVGFAKSLQSTNACHEIMEASGREIGIFINLTAKKGNIRSKDASINELARAFGGGGHPKASGFAFGKKYNVSTKKGRLLLLDKIDKEAAKLKL